MDSILPRSTGLDARFDAELKAAIPGWRSEHELTEEERSKNAESEASERDAER